MTKAEELMFLIKRLEKNNEGDWGTACNDLVEFIDKNMMFVN